MTEKEKLFYISPQLSWFKLFKDFKPLKKEELKSKYDEIDKDIFWSIFFYSINEKELVQKFIFENRGKKMWVSLSLNNHMFISTYAPRVLMNYLDFAEKYPTAYCDCLGYMDFEKDKSYKGVKDIDIYKAPSDFWFNKNFQFKKNMSEYYSSKDFLEIQKELKLHELKNKKTQDEKDQDDLKLAERLINQISI